jgi:hypothetical protein
MTAGHGSLPRLTVTSRHTAIGEDIYADHQAFWWSWSERIAPLSEPGTAARKITSVLRTTQPVAASAHAGRSPSLGLHPVIARRGSPCQGHQ